jgi:hypothetical protein
MSTVTNSSTRKAKKKVTQWTERYNTTVVVVGVLQGHDQFRRLLAQVKESVGDPKSHYYREEQHCGFIYFHDEASADKCKAIDGELFEGITLKAAAPLSYFATEDEIFPELGSNTRRPSTASTIASHYSADPTPTLVLKNLCFGLKQSKFLEFMSQCKHAPLSVSYHYDSAGLFRGVAFAKYSSVDQAAEAIEELKGVQLGGRTIKVEFKRRGGDASSPVGARRQMTRDSSYTSASFKRDPSFQMSPRSASHGWKSPTLPAHSHRKCSAPNPTYRSSAGSIDRSPVPSRVVPQAPTITFTSTSPSVPQTVLAQAPPDLTFAPSPARTPSTTLDRTVSASSSGAGSDREESDRSPPLTPITRAVTPPTPPSTPPAPNTFTLWPSSPVVLRQGEEFGEVQAVSVPPPVAVAVPPRVGSLFADGGVPVLRQGLEFAY